MSADTAPAAMPGGYWQDKARQLQTALNAERKARLAAEAALAAERERAAMVAERYDQSPGDDSIMGPVMAGQVAVAQSIAAAIRSGEAP